MRFKQTLYRKISSRTNISRLSFFEEDVRPETAWWAWSWSLSYDLFFFFLIFFFLIFLFDNLWCKHSCRLDFTRSGSLDFQRLKSLRFFHLEFFIFQSLTLFFADFRWATSVMRVERSVCLEEPFFAEFALEVLLLFWKFYFLVRIKIIELLSFFNVLFGKIIFLEQDLLKDHLNMFYLFTSVQNVFVVFKEFLFELGDDFFQECRANFTEDLIFHFSDFDVVGDFHFHVLDKFGEAKDTFHGRQGIYSYVKIIDSKVKFFRINTGKIIHMQSTG